MVNESQTFGQEMDQLSQKLKIPGISIAVLQNQEVIFAGGFGYADLENEVLATKETPYHIASLTKPFTAALIMQMVEAGRLNLDDAMSDILSDVNFLSFDITGYNNLCKAMRKYSNGKQDCAFLFKDYRGDIERITVRHHLTHTSQGVPGETYQYNGFLFGLLTEVLEKVSGKRFDELLVERIISPLKMSNTFPGQSDIRNKQILYDRAKPYQVDTRKISLFPSIQEG